MKIFTTTRSQTSRMIKETWWGGTTPIRLFSSRVMTPYLVRDYRTGMMDVPRNAGSPIYLLYRMATRNNPFLAHREGRLSVFMSGFEDKVSRLRGHDLVSEYAIVDGEHNQEICFNAINLGRRPNIPRLPFDAWCSESFSILNPSRLPVRRYTSIKKR